MDYIDSTNPKAPIAQRGKAKQKRTDLRLARRAPGVTTDHQDAVSYSGGCIGGL